MCHCRDCLYICRYRSYICLRHCRDDFQNPCHYSGLIRIGSKIGIILFLASIEFSRICIIICATDGYASVWILILSIVVGNISEPVPFFDNIWMCHHQDLLFLPFREYNDICQYRIFLLPFAVRSVPKFMSLSRQLMNMPL